MKTKNIIATLALAFLILLTSCAASEARQADSSLIICGGESMLIDGGNVADSDPVAAYLKKENISTIDYLVSAHAHEDRCGGPADALSTALAPQTEIEPAESGYIGNRNSKKFHRPNCRTLPDEKNRVPLSSREEAVSKGYSPCGNCNPRRSR